MALPRIFLAGCSRLLLIMARIVVTARFARGRTRNRFRFAAPEIAIEPGMLGKRRQRKQDRRAGHCLLQVVGTSKHGCIRGTLTRAATRWIGRFRPCSLTETAFGRKVNPGHPLWGAAAQAVPRQVVLGAGKLGKGKSVADGVGGIGSTLHPQRPVLRHSLVDFLGVHQHQPPISAT